MYAYFIDISQGSVKTHLWCGGIYKITLSQIVCRVHVHIVIIRHDFSAWEVF